MAFLSEEEHRIGFLDGQDVIGSEVVQDVPGEVLEQLESRRKPRSMIGYKHNRSGLS